MSLVRFYIASLVPAACQAFAAPDASLVEKLREGGYVLYLRHTSTDFGDNRFSVVGRIRLQDW